MFWNCEVFPSERMYLNEESYNYYTRVIDRPDNLTTNFNPNILSTSKFELNHNQKVKDIWMY